MIKKKYIGIVKTLLLNFLLNMSTISADFIVPLSGSSVNCGSLAVNGLPLASVSTVSSLSFSGPWSTSPATHGVKLISAGPQAILKFSSVYSAAATTGLATVTSFSATLPAGFIPTTPVAQCVYVVDAAANAAGLAQISTSGVLSISKLVPAAFGTSSACGIGAGSVIVYPLL